ncbi:MAG: P-loop NTPase [Candidatus Aenigmarchaeota archaeon]|nr:P-loop NTPase [Candidatus Aenigmarchaeota archaeon]
MLVKNPFQQMLEREERVREKLSSIPCKIGVHSGKGGVGKTTVAINLAATLAQRHRVTLLDADIDCPDVGRMLGIEQRLSVSEQRTLLPAEKYGMGILSAAFLMDADSLAIMRGPLKHHALMQMLAAAELGGTNYLVIDMPPGTGDIPLTVMQLGLSGIVAVTTPQAAALQDTHKSIAMAQRLGAPVLGIIENMAGGAFGSGGGKQLAEAAGMPFLGSIVLDKRISELGDRGVPPALEHEQLAEQFREITARLRESLNEHI